MTDNEIIKGAEHCLNPKYACDDCPYTDTGEHQEECMAVLIKDLLSLINRQKAEIIKEQNKNSKLRNERNRLKAEIDKQYEIAEANVRAEIADGGTSCHWCADKVRAEAIKEFAERLKADLCNIPRVDHGGHVYYLVGKEAIDNLVKEMVGDNNA